MKNIDELLGVAKLSELMSNDKKDESKKVLWVLAIIGAVAAVAGIAALVYKYLSPDSTYFRHHLPKQMNKPTGT